MRPILYYSDRYVVDLGDHVFPMGKYRLVRHALLSSGLARENDFVEPAPAAAEDALLVHTRAYVDKLLAGTLSPLEIARLELPFTPALARAAFLGAGGTIAAARSALERGVGVNVAGGFHHAFPDHGEGFCILNDVAMAVARVLKDGAVLRVAVVDCDVHQGNGTASIFANDDRVFTFSIHQEQNYPFVKPPSSLDVGLPTGADGSIYLPHLEAAVGRILETFLPELVLYVAGADPFAGDLLGGLALTKHDLSERDRIVTEACAAAGVPIALTLAGGYAARTSDTVDIHAATIARAIVVGRSLG
jgi:acetoin utilization deacetylase AcuC-like enzyme